MKAELLILPHSPGVEALSFNFSFFNFFNFSWPCMETDTKPITETGENL